MIFWNTGSLLVEYINAFKNKSGRGFAGVSDQIVKGLVAG
jgi:hypothetical protein